MWFSLLGDVTVSIAKLSILLVLASIVTAQTKQTRPAKVGERPPQKCTVEYLPQHWFLAQFNYYPPIQPSEDAPKVKALESPAREGVTIFGDPVNCDFSKTKPTLPPGFENAKIAVAGTTLAGAELIPPKK